MKNSWVRFLVSGVVFLVGIHLAWAQTSPVVMMQGIADQMIAGLEQHKGELKANPSVINRIVRSALLPSVNVSYMSASVVGRPWRSAAAGQRNQFMQDFTGLVISTYSKALASYDGDVVKFYPLRGNWAGASAVVVKSTIIRRNGQQIPVAYYLHAVGGSWQIYDFAIENVSLIQTYRAQFADTLAQGGLPLLLNRLAAHQIR